MWLTALNTELDLQCISSLIHYRTTTITFVVPISTGGGQCDFLMSQAKRAQLYTFIQHASNLQSNQNVSYKLLPIQLTVICIFGTVWPVPCWCGVNFTKTNETSQGIIWTQVISNEKEDYDTKGTIMVLEFQNFKSVLTQDFTGVQCWTVSKNSQNCLKQPVNGQTTDIHLLQ